MIVDVQIIGKIRYFCLKQRRIKETLWNNNNKAFLQN